MSQKSQGTKCTYRLLLLEATPGGTHGNSGVMGTVLVFLFSPAGEESCLVSETTSLDQGDIPTKFVRVLASSISL